MCPVCEVIFTSRVKVREHIKKDHSKNDIANVDLRTLPRVCNVCYKVFYTSKDLDHHRLVSQHYARGANIPCHYCHRRFKSDREKTRHLNKWHFKYYKILKTAFNGKLQTLGRVFNPYTYRTINSLHKGEEARLLSIFTGYLKRFNSISAHLVVHVNCANFDEVGAAVDAINVPLSTRSKIFFSGQRYKLQQDLSVMMRDAQDRVDALELQGSGYSLRYVTGISIQIGKKDYAGGARGDMFVSWLSGKERACLVDVQSHIQNGCLFTAVAQAYLPPLENQPDENRYYATKHFIEKYMVTTKIPTPCPLSRIAKFEKLNAHDLDFGINVYMKGRRSDHDDFAGSGRTRTAETTKQYFYYPVYVSERRDCRKQVNLLLIRNPDNSKLMHFIYISDLDRLLKIRPEQTACPRCLQKVGKNALENHLRLCNEHEAQTVKMPTNNDDGSPPLLEFYSGSKRFLNPIIGFCDFESINVECTSEKRFFDGGGATNLEGDVSGTNVLCSQEPIMYTFMFLDDQNNVLLEKSCVAESKQLMKSFYSDLKDAHAQLFPLLNDMACVRPTLTPRQQEEFYAATRCWICEKEFCEDGGGDENYFDDKVLDHSHSSLQGGRYLGAAHRSCNLARRHQEHIPLFVHNLTNYDGMFLVNALADREICENWEVSGIPENTEKFRSLTIGNFKFLDSFHFLGSSLSKLVDDLVHDNYSFPILDRFAYNRINGVEHKQLLIRKSSYPYDYATSLAVLKNSQYPEHEHFYSKLQEKNISSDLYDHGKRVYDFAQCKNLEDYTLLYNKLDVYLLAEVVVNFRKHTYNEFRLDITQFLSSPHLAFNIMLLLNKTKIELVTDGDMHLMVEKGLRGGVTHAALRHIKLNEPYNEEKDPTLLYTDCVNLYGYAMQQKLPVGDYTWLKGEEILKHDWTAAADDDDYGHVVECDLEYPSHLHDAHNSLPLAPEQREIKFPMLSEFSKTCYKEAKPGNYKKHKTQKLCSTFYEKKDYVVHSRNLALYLKLGMKLKKVKRAIRFRQEAFLKDYIELMTRKRQAAKTKFAKTFYKLLINSIYGKLVQNVRKQLNCVFVQNEKRLSKCLSNPCFQHFRIIGKNCAVFFNRKRIVKMNKPYIAGFSVLDISKCHMFDLFYNKIKPAAPSAEIVLTDTDSLLLTVPDMPKSQFLDSCESIFDFSNYPTDHKRFSTEKKMIPGYLKDENASKPLVEVVALKAKVYAIRTEDDSVEKKCKGVSTRIVERDFTMDTYLSCLSQVSTLRVTSSRLRCKTYKIDLIESRKIGLTTGDDKRFLVSQFLFIA